MCISPKNLTRRWAGHGKHAPLHHPRLFFPGENDLYSVGIQGNLPGKGWEKGRDFRCLRAAPPKSGGMQALAAMCSHVPKKGEQMVRYYGYYSNVKRGRRKNKNQDEWMPCILEANESSKEYRKNWAQLFQRIYEADPLTCPKCSGKMKVISVIEDEDVTRLPRLCIT